MAKVGDAYRAHNAKEIERKVCEDAKQVVLEASHHVRSTKDLEHFLRAMKVVLQAVSSVHDRDAVIRR
eukprot:1921683-Amphidinium_carterae.1